MELRLDDLPIHVQMKILRTVAGISAQGMAARWGKSPAYVYRVERGESPPTPLEIKDALEAAGIASAQAVRAALAEVADASRAAEALQADAPGEDEPQPGEGESPQRPSP